MSEQKVAKEPRIAVDFPIKLPVKIGVGATSSKFLIELRDNKRIMGIKCPTCNKVYMPPRSACPVCLSKMEDWVELSGEGALVTYTVVYYREEYQPVEPPIIFGIIQLDGADTGLCHLISEIDPENVKTGMRVEPVFKEEREGSVLDIKYFRPSKT